MSDEIRNYYLFRDPDGDGTRCYLSSLPFRRRQFKDIDGITDVVVHEPDSGDIIELEPCGTGWDQHLGDPLRLSLEEGEMRQVQIIIGRRVLVEDTLQQRIDAAVEILESAYCGCGFDSDSECGRCAALRTLRPQSEAAEDTTARYPAKCGWPKCDQEAIYQRGPGERRCGKHVPEGWKKIRK